MLSVLGLLAYLVQAAETSLSFDDESSQLTTPETPKVGYFARDSQEVFLARSLDPSGGCLVASDESDTDSSSRCSVEQFQDAGYATLTDSPPRDSTNPVSQDATNPISRDSTNPVSQDATNPISRESTNPISRGSTNPISQDSTDRISRDSTNPISRDTINTISQDSTNPISQDSTNPISQDSTNTLSQGDSTDYADLISRDTTDAASQASYRDGKDTDSQQDLYSAAAAAAVLTRLRHDCAAGAGALDRVRHLAPIRFNQPDCPQQEEAEFGPVTVFPSLSNARLSQLGLLPASLADLQAANTAVSIVDPNCRYRMEGPQPVAPQDGGGDSGEEAAAAADDAAAATTLPPVEDRVRELEISFANDASTLGERVRRVSLARASLEANLVCEMDSLEAKLLAAAAGAGATASPEMIGAVRLVRETAGRLSRTAEVLGAVEQECRLNFAFHLVHKYSDDLRTEKERMATELDILRQAVEDENFYVENEAFLFSKYEKSGGGNPGSPSTLARAKFQQLSRNVARTSSITSLLQRLARERQRRNKRLAEEAGATQRSLTDAVPAPDVTDSSGTTSSGSQPSADAANHPIRRGHSSPSQSEGEPTVLDKLDSLTAKLYADRRVRIFLVPMAMLVAIVFLLWAIAYPIVKRIFT